MASECPNSVFLTYPEKETSSESGLFCACFRPKRWSHYITFDHIPSAPTKRSPSNLRPSSNMAVTYTHPTNTTALETGNTFQLEWKPKYNCSLTLLPSSIKSTTWLSFNIASSPTARARICCSVMRLMTLVTGSPRSAAGVNVSNLQYLNINLALSNGCLQQRNCNLKANQQSDVGWQCKTNAVN